MQGRGAPMIGSLVEIEGLVQLDGSIIATKIEVKSNIDNPTLFVRFRDVGQVWELTTQILFYASPIIIPVGFLPPWSQPIAFLNPFVQIMQDVRAVVVYDIEVITATSRLAPVGGRLAPIAIALGTLVVGLYIFKRESPWFAERV